MVRIKVKGVNVLKKKSTADLSLCENKKSGFNQTKSHKKMKHSKCS